MIRTTWKVWAFQFCLHLVLIFGGLLVVAALLTGCSSAYADPGQLNTRGGDRCYGKNCVTNTLTLRASPLCLSAAGGTGSIRLEFSDVNVRFVHYSGKNCTGVADQNMFDTSLLQSQAMSGPLVVPQGGAGSPTLTFNGDNNTGLYNSGADQLAVTTGGTAQMLWRGGGYLSTPALNSNLVLTESASSIGTTNGIVECTGTVCRSQAPAGWKITAYGNTRGFSGAGAPSLQGDSELAHLWATQNSTTYSATNAPFDLGGAPHPVLQQRMYVLDVGTESTATPTFWVAPRTGGSAATITLSEASSSTATYGTAPGLWDFRASVTSAVSGNIASAISSNFAKRNRAVRWCQRVGLSTVANVRAWVGLSSALPGATDTNNTANHASYRFTAGVDTNWQACSSDGTTQSCTDTGKAPGSGTGFSLLCIDCREAAACTYWVDGVAVTRKTTNLPSSGTNMGLFWSVETAAAATREIRVTSATVEFN